MIRILRTSPLPRPATPRPTGSSWINQVERFLALLTERRIRRGVDRSVAALQAAIQDYIDHHNADPKPFRWTKSILPGDSCSIKV